MSSTGRASCRPRDWLGVVVHRSEPPVARAIPADGMVEGGGGQVLNEVRLVGRLAEDPAERTLPSGDVLVTLRVVVDREVPERTTRRKAVDALECAVWDPRLQRRVLRWRAGAVVEVSGALRRRFFRGGGGAAQSRVEVEVTAGRVSRRAPAA